MRVRILVLGALLPAGAFANGAMGLAYEVWSFVFWLAYVAAMVLLEAWWMGKRLGLKADLSLLYSGVANGITALACFINPLSAAMHGSPSEVDRNPLDFGIWALVIFAIPTALVEGFAWAQMVKKQFKEIALHSLFIHAVGVPIALVILLIPERPYIGIENTTALARRRVQRTLLKRALEDYVKKEGQFPLAKTSAELVKALNLKQSDLIFFDPSYKRFSTRDDRDKPWTLNSSLSGKPIKASDKPDWQMIAQSKNWPDRGLYINFSDGEVRQGLDPAKEAKKP